MHRRHLLTKDHKASAGKHSVSFLRALRMLQALAYRAKRHEAEACLEELRADVRSLGAVERQQGAGGQGRVASVTDEVEKLQEVVRQQEQEQKRLEVRAARPQGG